jgi:hypothetical protein
MRGDGTENATTKDDDDDDDRNVVHARKEERRITSRIVLLLISCFCYRVTMLLSAKEAFSFYRTQ